MNKKVMALAVAGAFATPAVALAQAANVQIFGTAYIEYSYVKQGAKNTIGNGDLINNDTLQTPGMEIGIKGEEALGGGLTFWFQCTSTADIRGSAPQGFCGRNSAMGLKGAFGNVFAGNWDMPTKRTAGGARMLSDTGLWGTGFLLFSNSSSFNDNVNNNSAFSRRQNSSIFYDSPVFSGFQAFVGISTPASASGNTTNQSGAKPRMYSVAANYTNGPLLLTAGYERHDNFQPGLAAGVAQSYSGQDTGWQAGASYVIGPVKLAGIYASQKYDTSTNSATPTELKVNSWQLSAQWNIAGPHSLRGGYTKSNDTSGNFSGAVGTGSGARIGNAGVGNTGAQQWQAQYVYQASKRTEMTAGYVHLSNDANARYSLGGYTQPAGGQNQNGFGISLKNAF